MMIFGDVRRVKPLWNGNFTFYDLLWVDTTGGWAIGSGSMGVMFPAVGMISIRESDGGDRLKISIVGESS
jgi:hypothetical protein